MLRAVGHVAILLFICAGESIYIERDREIDITDDESLEL